MNRHQKRALIVAVLIETLTLAVIAGVWMVQPHAHIFDYGVMRGIVAVLLFILPIAIGSGAFAYAASKDVG